MRNVIILLSLIVLAGCTPSNRPSDLPPLYPCAVSVTQEGVPLVGAYVELVPTDTQKYRPASTTVETGEAVILTYGFPGAPVGKYKIIVRKSIDDDIVYGKDEYGQPAIISSNRYNVVLDQFGDVSQTPHEIEVAADSKGVTATIDVGKAIKVRFQGTE